MSFLSEPISIIPIQPMRQIGNINVNVVISESTNDTLTITKQPVQQGATITDHAFMEPTTFSTSILFGANLTQSMQKIYQSLLSLQSDRVPFNIVTPKRLYSSMLLTSLGMTTDRNTENSLSITLTATQIIIVAVTTSNTPRQNQSTPAKTGATQNAGNKSALLSLTQGVTSLFTGGL